MANKDKCFIITPIGDDTDPIRRHIEGIIDAALRPALEDKYDLVVAHRISEPGSITKQIITEIYSAKLVVANLTNRNPNVMYELALRHSLGKPVIMIAEKGTPLPSDIVMERTIFYQNDARGVIELRESIAAAEKEIDYDKTESPIYNVLHDVLKDRQIIEFSESQSISREDDGNATVLKYILQKLTNLEDAVQTSRPLMQNAESRRYFDGVVFAFSYVKSTQPYQVDKLLMRLQRVPQIEQEISVVNVHIYEEEKKIWVYTMGLSDKSNASDIYHSFAKTLSQFGFEGVKAIHP